ncbi:Spore protein YkvP [compost metagenome]
MFVQHTPQHTPPFPGNLADFSGRRGWEEGIKDGYAEGYLRGRAKVIVGAPKQGFAFRQVKILYVGTGKSFPYSPIDEAIIATLQTLAAEVIVSVIGQPIGELAATHKPDLVLVLDGVELPTDQIDTIRGLGIRTAIWFTDDPYYTDFTSNIAPHYDYVFTMERNCIDYYRSLGCSNVYYLPFAAYTEHYRPSLTLSPIRRNISFIGSAYWNRVNFFQPIIGRLMESGLVINGIWWDRLPEHVNYTNQIELGKWMGPLETSEAYSGSKIVINLHRSPIDESVNNNTIGVTASSPNPRTFEIAACGTLQLVDVREDLASFYTPGVEIETYSTSEELMEKVNFYLTHEKERQEIALRALEKTYRDHTYSNRIHQMFEHIFG